MNKKILFFMAMTLIPSFAKAESSCSLVEPAYEEIKPKFDYLINNCLENYENDLLDNSDEKCEMYYADAICIGFYPAVENLLIEEYGNDFEDAFIRILALDEYFID